MSVSASECPDLLENLKESMRDPKEILSVAGHRVVDLSGLRPSTCLPDPQSVPDLVDYDTETSVSMLKCEYGIRTRTPAMERTRIGGMRKIRARHGLLDDPKRGPNQALSRMREGNRSAECCQTSPAQAKRGTRRLRSQMPVLRRVHSRVPSD